MSPFKRKIYSTRPVYPGLFPLNKIEATIYLERKKGLSAAISLHKALNQCRKCGLMKTITKTLCQCG